MTFHFLTVGKVAAVWKLVEKAQGAIAAQIRVMLGEPAFPPAMFDEAQQARRIASMQQSAANAFTSDAARHDDWIAQHVAAGWKLGEKFDPIAKTHPNLRPWHELAPAEQGKIEIFRVMAELGNAIGVVAIAAEPLETPPVGIDSVEMQEFLFAKTAADAAFAQVMELDEAGTLWAGKLQDAADLLVKNIRSAMLLQRQFVFSWLMQNGVAIPMQLICDDAHRPVGQQRPDMPLQK